MSRPRRRVFDLSQKQNPGYHYYYSNGNWVNPAYFSNHTEDYVSDVMDDYVTENFFERAKKGEYVNNPLSHVRVEAQSAPGDRIFYNQTNGQPTDKYTNQTWLDLTYGVTGKSTFDSQALNTVSAQAYAGVDASAASLLVTTGELRETLSLGNAIAKAHTRLASSFSSKQRKGSRERAKAVNDAYLTGKYGIMPLWNDIRSIANAVSVASEERQYATSRGKTTYSLTDKSDTYINAQWTQRKECRLQCTYRAYVRYELPPRDGFSQFNKAYGLRLRDSVDAIWDLTPYSFVVDGFTNLGNLISSYLPRPGVRILGAGYSVTNEWSWQCYPVLSGAYPPTGITPGSGRASEKFRSPYLPFPSFSFKPAVFDDWGKDDIARCLNVLSLALARVL